MTTAPGAAQEDPSDDESSEALWIWARSCSAAQREIGAARARLMYCVAHYMDGGASLGDAIRSVSDSSGVSASNLRNWYYGAHGRSGVRHFGRADWPALLIPGHRGGGRQVKIPQQAWDWFVAHYLSRRQPTIAEAYRRTREAAQAHRWGDVPSLKTFERRLRSDVATATRTYLREGADALAKLYPSQRRDKTVFSAGEAVSGDGLKFDRVYVRWPDGEVLSTTTGWFWGDIRTNRILAYRLAKTENTDLFRLATYDLTALCVPTYAWMDNTVVAANKAMTGGAKGRHRFKDQPHDPTGLLLQLGIEPRFTTPPGEGSNPGAKPIERSFGIGGIHELVATSPRLRDRAYSRATAIAYEEFAEIVAQEVARFNAQPKRRTPVCRGVLSFDEAFAESFDGARVRRATQAQRQLLLLMPEVVRADRTTGEVRLHAGRGPHGRHRYWTEALAEQKGQQIVAYYDPEALAQPIAVYTLQGRFICMADHLADVAFHDTATAREWAKNKQRSRKAAKAAAAAERRMRDLEVAALYPQQDAPDPPQPGVLRGNFNQRRQVVDGQVVDRTPARDEEREAAFERAVNGMVRQLREDSI